MRDLNKINLPANTYHFVVCWDSMHHILESKRLIQMAYHSLMPGGKFLLLEHIPQRSPMVNRLNQTIEKILALVSHHTHAPATSAARTDGEILHSPFEDVTGREMIDYCIDAFGRENITFETALAFGATWLARIRGPKKLRLGLVTLIKLVDAYLIRKRVVEGEYVYIEGIKL